MRMLDIGCGKNKIHGAIGLDIHKTPATDVVCDLDKFPYPFRSNTFDKIYMMDVLEHLDDIKGVMEDVYRIAKPRAEVYIRVPHFSSTHAYGDFTHKHFFNTESFNYFTGNFPQYDFYSSAKFYKTKIKINFWRLHRINGISFLANKFPLFYEKYLGFIFPAMNIEVCLKVIKIRH
ncbi:MAG: methyltransferase domain-containing protein [Deltaproteobacteria bacterium]|nr:methyltransferase domain-containing protein [Deltaproteobacteria bacterium]